MARQEKSPRCMGIVGGEGTGKSRLLKDLRYHAQLRGCEVAGIAGRGAAEGDVRKIAERAARTDDGAPAMLICIDDLSEAAASCGALRNTLDALSNRMHSSLFPLGMGIVYADDISAGEFEGHQETIALGNFSPSEVAEYVKAVADPPERHVKSIADEIMDRTRGNPLLVTKLCLNLVARGFLGGEVGLRDEALFDDIPINFSNVNISDAIAGSLETTIARLPGNARDIVECLAVWNDRVTEFDLSRTFDIKSTASFNSSLLELEGLQLLALHPRQRAFGIRDGFTRSAIFGKMDDARIAGWHERIAAYLAKRYPPPRSEGHQYELDKHLSHGPDAGEAHAALLRLAGHERRNGMAAIAAERLETRLSHEGDRSRHHEIALELCRCWLHQGKHGRITEMWRDSVGTTDDLEALRVLGQAYMEMHDFDDAEAAFARAAKLCGDDRPAERIAFNAHVGRIRMLTGDFDAAIAIFENASALWRGLPHEQRESIDNIEFGEALRLKGDLKKALPQIEDELAWFEGIGKKDKAAIRRYSLAEAFRALGDHGRALDLFDEGISSAREIGDSALLSRLYNGLGAMLIMQGKSEGAIIQLERGLSHAYRLGDVHSIAVMTINIGRCYNDLKDLKKAGDYLTSARLFSEGEKTDVRWADNALCQIYLESGDVLGQQGDAKAALECLDRADEIADSRPDLKAYKKNIAGVRERMRKH